MNTENNNGFHTQLYSGFSFEGVIVDVCFENQLIAQISYREGMDQIKVEFFPRNTSKLTFKVNDFIEILERAKKRAANYSKKDFEVTICSLPDRDFLVAEICFKNIQWVEIHHEEEEMKIQFYPHPNLPCWEFNLNEALEALAEAKRKLVAMGPKN